MGILANEQLTRAIIRSRLKDNPQIYLTKLGEEEDLKTPLSDYTIKLLKEFQIENLIIRENETPLKTYITHVIPMWKQFVLF